MALANLPFLEIFTADANGQFDYIAVLLQNSNASPSLCQIKVNVSDTP
jgi:hypothetical protein